MTIALYVLAGIVALLGVPGVWPWLVRIWRARRIDAASLGGLGREERAQRLRAQIIAGPTAQEASDALSRFLSATTVSVKELRLTFSHGEPVVVASEDPCPPN